MKLFHYDNRISLFLSRVADFVILNVLWILCSVPIVTIGVSTTAYYYCMLNIVRDTDYGIVKMFFHSFKENLKQGIILGLIVIGTVVLLGIDILVCSSLGGSFFQVMKMLLLVVTGIVMVPLVYVFPVFAQFDNSIKNIIKNAFIIGISNLKYTLLIMMITSIPIVLAIYFTQVFLMLAPFWCIVGMSVLVFLKTKLIVKIFDEIIQK